MEEKKLDVKSIIGFVLISVVLMWMMYTNTPTPKQAEEKTKTEQVTLPVKTENDSNNTTVVSSSSNLNNTNNNDSINHLKAQQKLGSFGYSATLASAKETSTIVKNKLLALEISNKGGYISNLEILGFEKFSKNSGLPVELIKNNNTLLNLTLTTTDNRVIQTKDLYFEPTLTKEGENQVVAMRLKAGENQFLEYRYTLKPNDYMLDFSIRSQGLEKILVAGKSIDLEWQLKTYRNEKSISYENRYTEVVYDYEKGKDDYLSNTSNEDEETVTDVSYIAYKQHLFTSILLTNTLFKTAELYSENLVKDEATDTIYTKNFVSKIPLELKNGALNYDMNLYFGPAKYEILNSYNRNLDEVMSLGWGIFGWINCYIFIPVFGFISSFLPYGLAIIVLTILVKLVLSPITYKSYLSQAKMKVLRPEIAELNEKYKNNAMKKQQETMKLYSKAGVNPMAGCIPALLQMPVLYALIYFFPSVFDLRQKSFLWADDLSSYDSVFQLPFKIPFYGDHISLFPILASLAIFFYMRMTTGDQQMSTPQQEGMPDMAKMMKIMLYISPLMMLFFFNNYASGMSLYYFISNLITIGIMFVIKNYIIDNDKIHDKIQENKTKPKKESKFARRMREAMEQAQAQQNAKKK